MLHVNLTMQKSFSQKQLLLVGAIFFLALSLAAYRWILLPQYEELVKWREAKIQATQELSKINLFYATHPQGNQYLAELDQKLILENQKIPGEAAMGDYIETIAELVWQQGLILEKVTPAKAAKRQGYYEIPLEISLSGSFFSVIGFLQQCEGLPRLMTVHKVSLAAKDKKVDCTMAISIYAYSLSAEFLQEKPGGKSANSNKAEAQPFKQQ